MNRLTPRERLLSGIILGMILVVGNLSLFSALKGRSDRLRAAIAANGSAIQSMRSLLAQGELSAAREAWVQAHQPQPGNPEQAGVELLEQIKETARAQEVLIESPELGGLETQPACRSVSVQFNAKSSWPSLVKFLHAMQQPGRFIVFETASLQVDPAHPNQMTSRFKIAKWFAR